jgi:peptide chain release factor 2
MEAQDFAKILKRMYEKWFYINHFKYELIEEQDNSVIFSVLVPFNSVILDNEKGHHKMTRISPFGNGKLHTSIVKVNLFSIDIEKEIVIEEKDIIVEAFKATGPGGQHRNKVESAIRIKHIPSGIITTASSSRSQHDNKKTALKQLKIKLLNVDKLLVEQEKLTHYKKDLNSFTLVRSYLINHNMIVNEKNKKSTQKVKQVMNGNLNLII